MSASGLGRKGALALLAAAAAAAAVQSAWLGASSHHAQLAHAHLEPWTVTKLQLEGRARDAAEFHAQKSLHYAAGNPEALGQMGTLGLAKMRESRVPAQALAAAQAARRDYRRALERRPTSPFLWANLALAKLYLDEIDDEMADALRRANLLGPWEPAVQQATVFVGLAAWHKLDADVHDVLAGAIERAGHRNAAAMYGTVNSYGRLDLLCGIEGYQAPAVCQNGADKVERNMR
ncbi:MAG: hypothetical protein O2975_06525 [Proteobacteria bacterium]|nr:hypothetical protein [Pseudomonadota bacterium]